MMSRVLRSAVLAVSATVILVCCTKENTEAVPDNDTVLTVGTIAVVPSDGIVDGRFQITITDRGNNEVKVMPDGTVVTEASFDETTSEIVFTVGENTGMVRSGYIVLSCGKAAEVAKIEQRPGTILKGKSGWYEIPAIVDNDSYIYYSHSSLPSAPDRRNYSFCFSTDMYASLWVAYPLHECYLGSADRRDTFGYDKDFATFCGDVDCGMQAQVSGAYYTEFGNTVTSSTNLQYSRGHQLPSADRTASSADNDTSFYATNMTPQRQSLNGGAWYKLENLVRTQWMCSDTLYVVTGAMFEDGHATAYDNKSRGKCVPVPTKYWKVLLRTRDGNTGRSVAECSASELQCIGFVLEHNDSRGSQKVYTTDARSVEQMEELTGFTFFPTVPNAPKNVCDTSLWGGLTAQ